MANRAGLVGFLLSVIQLLGHTSWILLIWWLSVSGRAQKLTADSGWSWLVVSLLAISLLLTCLSLFICLFYGLRRPPRTLALAGLSLSFFVGVLASAMVFMTAIRAMTGS